MKQNKKPKRTSKTIFKVTCDKTITDVSEALDINELRVNISKGVSGPEMTYGIVALLSVVLAHQNANGDNLSIAGFLNLIKMMMEDMQVGIPKEQDEVLH